MEKCHLSDVNKPMLETIHEEEDSATRQNESSSDLGRVSVGIDMIEGRDDIPKDPDQVDELEKNSLDSEDNGVVIVDLIGIVCNKQKCSADKSEDFNSDTRLAGEISKHKPDIVRTRGKTENDEVDFLPDISDVDSLSIEKNSKTLDHQEETSFSTNKDSTRGHRSRNDRQSFRDKTRRSQASSSAEEVRTPRCQHSTNSFVMNIEDNGADNLEADQSWMSQFNWDDFGYSLILGFAPTAWDVYSDLKIADQLEDNGDSYSAGLSFLFICFPGLYLFNEVLTEKLSSSCSNMIVIIVNFSCGFSLSSAMIYASWTYPLLFRNPAILIGFMVVITKGLAIFVHTPGMKKLSSRITMCEFNTESPLQLLLLLHLWVSKGTLYRAPIFSSLLVIGKVNAEIYLSDQPENLMKGKSFPQKLLLTLRYIPLFASTAFFRVGCGIIKHSGPYSSVASTFPTFAFFLSIWAGSIFFFLLYLITFATVKLAFPNSLADISMMELGRGILAEFTTVSIWGGLGREGSK